MVAGEAIALLVIPVFQNLKILDLIRSWDAISLFWFLVLWLLFLPTAVVVGLYFFYRVSVARWPIFFQIGKYGIVGWLNTFLFAGLVNFLVWLTGIAEGFSVDLFAIIAFVLSSINSFYWNKFWTFEAKNTVDIKKEYIKFFVISAVMSLINTGVIHLLVNTIGAPQAIDAKIWVNIVIAITIPIAFFGNFLGYKIFVFKDKNV